MGIFDGKGWVNWATVFYWKVMLPSFKAHHLVWQRVAILDRFLEKRKMWSNFFIGVLFGVACYFCVLPLLPHPVDRTISSMRSDMDEILALAKIDCRHEMPSSAVSRLRMRTLSRVYEVKDAVDVKRQREESAAEREKQATTVAELKNILTEV